MLIWQRLGSKGLSNQGKFDGMPPKEVELIVESLILSLFVVYVAIANQLKLLSCLVT